METHCKLVIGGPNRSGTSLIRALVGSHPMISAPRTEPNLQKYLKEYRTRYHKNFGSKKMIYALLKERKLYKLDLDARIIQMYLAEYKLDEMGIYNSILRSHADKENKPYFAEKTTYNEQYFGDYYQWFGDNLRFLYIVRNPIDTIASMLHYRGIRRSIDPISWCSNWEKSVETALSLHDKYPNQFKLVKYEDVLTNIRKIASDLCDFMSVPAEVEKMINFESYQNFDNSSFPLEKKQKEGSIVVDRNNLDRSVYVPKRLRFYLVTRLKKLAKKIHYDIGESTLLGSIYQTRGIRHLIRIEGMRFGQKG